MVRAPCCDKMGLKKGPWTHEEDQILISFIQNHGHDNWRALPKQAGLLRCGKSCRLRWINYLKPDIKRGNFTLEEEETIIQLHEMLGNRWSAIAAKLPGRTDNEIKNVWHTHLKKRLEKYQTKNKPKSKNKNKLKSEPSISIPSSTDHDQIPSSSSSSSSSEVSSIITDTTTTSTTTSSDDHHREVVNNTIDTTTTIKAEDIDSWVIDESFWSDNSFSMTTPSSDDQYRHDQVPSYSIDHNMIMGDSTDDYMFGQNLDDDFMEFWYDLFIKAGGEQEDFVAQF